MKTYKFVFVGILVSIVFLLALPHAANAKGDTVYITPNNISPVSAGGTVSYQIYMDTLGGGPAVAGINGWDLIVNDSDPSMSLLSPVSISISGNALASFGQVSELVNCVNNGTGLVGIVPGNIGCNTTVGFKDGPGVVHTAAVLLGPPTPDPISGLVANITYTVVDTFSPTSLSFTSHTFTDGSGAVPNTALGATFGTPATPDFRISAPNGTRPAPFNPGGSGSAKVNFTSLTLFTGPLTITDTIYPATGLTFSCNAPLPNPILAGGTSSADCNFNSKIPGKYVVTLNVTSLTIMHLAPITIMVGDFSVTGPASTLNFPGTSSATVTVTSVNGFAGTVNIAKNIAGPDFTISASPALGSVGTQLTSTITVDTAHQFSGSVSLSDTAPASLTCQPFSPSSTVNVPPKALSLLTCSSATAGTFEVAVSGVSGGITHTTSATFTFGSRPAFSISAGSPPTGNTGDNLVSSISVLSYSKFNGTLQLSDTVPPGLSCRPISPASIAFPIPPVPPGTYSATASLSCSSQIVGTFQVAVSATNVTVTQTSIATFNFKNLLIATCPASVNVPAGGSVPTTCNFTSSAAGNYVVMVTGNFSFIGGSIVHTATININAAGFSLTSPSPVIFGAGNSLSANVTVTPKLGFTGTVSITSSVNATTVTCTAPSLTFTTATAQNTICTTPPLRPATFIVNVTGTSGLVSNSLIITVKTSPDFTLSATDVTMSPGATATSTITVTSYGITSPVSLSYTIPPGLACPGAPTSATPNATVALGCSATGIGNYPVNVTGTSGSLSHSAIATFSTGPDIAVTKVSVSTTTANVGDKVTVTVTIKYNGTGSNFQILVRWGQITVAKQNFTISGPGPTDFNVVWDTSGYSPGNATISALVPPLTSGSYTETTPNDNTANGPSFTLQPAPSSSLSGATLYAVIGVIVAAAAGAGAFIFLRRRRKGVTTP